MSPFAKFHEQYGAGERCRQVPAERMAEYGDRLPASIIEEWRTNGWCSYGRGFIWFVDPAELADVLEDWIEDAERYVVFGRTATADLFLWGEGQVQHLDVQTAELAPMTKSADLFVNYSLCRDSYLDDVLLRQEFLQALSRLGPLEFDECYAFEPAVALGGPGTAETLNKVKLREHLGILAQLSLG